MFYSVNLLSKTGPLAEIWLASHVERKLNKQKILSQDIASSVKTITEEVKGPMALRMTGSLMLGVVRIYGRKARYLLDDCNEALLKIRMTFKSTNNHDLPNQGITTANINLAIPDALTIDDLFPALDFNFTLSQPAASQNDRELGYTDEWASTLEPHTQTPIRDFEDEGGIIQDDDLGLDLGEDVGMDTTMSMHMGRGEQTPMAQDTTDLPVYDEAADDLGLDLGEDVGMMDITVNDVAPIEATDETALLRAGSNDREESPLSEADPTMMAEGDRTFTQEQVEEEQVVAQQRQTNRRIKPMQPDRETTIHNSTIKAQNADRSKILKAQTMLPQDLELLALMDMQRNGDFVTNAMNDGHGSTWAPEIQGLLSFDLVYRAGQKRKRDSGIADIASEDEHSDKSPRLDRDAQEEAVVDEGVEIRGDSPIQQDDLVPGDDAGLDFPQDDEGIPGDAGYGGFDDTTMPLVHPADSGPVSVSTQHAVHLLRDIFGEEPSSKS